MSRTKKILLKSLLYILIPLGISLAASYILKCTMLIPAAVIFGIMIIFMIPTDSFFSSSVDYQTKTLNPTFRPSKLDKKLESAESIINFIFVLLALIICLILLYLQYS
jgi:hypothetical protein